MQESQQSPRDTVRILAALSDENRFRIVELLAGEDEELTCGAISKALGMSPSLLSHHLAILADAGIVGRRKNGLWTMNALERPVLARHVQALQGLLDAGSGNGNGHANGRLGEGAGASENGSGPAEGVPAGPAPDDAPGLTAS